MAESFGVEDRGHFYDPVGALRDVVVNHLMQVVAAAAMEPPSSGDPDALKDALVGVYRAMPDGRPGHYVRGQYDGYRAIDGVAPDSTTETYAALRLEIDNWRWGGVPWLIRTGKCLPVTQTELRVVFRRPPKLGFVGWSRIPEPSQMVVKLDPTTGLRMLVDAQRHFTVEPEQINLDMEFATEGGEGPTPVRGAAARRDGRRQPAIHAPGRSRRVLAGYAAADRRATAGASVREGHLGTRGRRGGRGWLWALAPPLGCGMSSTVRGSS